MNIFKPKLLNRKRINKSLENIFDKSIFIIIASAGYGKSTLVHKFLNSKKDVAKIWISLNETEIDRKLILQELYLAIYKVYPELAQKVLDYGLPKNSVDMEHFINLLTRFLTKPTVLVLDDYQEINDIYTDNLIEGLTYANIPNLHIVIISHLYPKFSYGELLLKGYCSILEQSNIAFNLNEINEFFKLNGFSLVEDELFKIYNYTDGWIAAVYLILVCYERNKKLDYINSCSDLIKTAIYNKLNDELKILIAMLAPLDNFTLEQAVFITQNKKIIKIIKGLNENHCFLKCNYKTKEYNLHKMLKVVALEDLKRFNIDIKRIFKLNGDWYLNEKQFILAIKFYYKARAYDYILNIIEQNLDYKLIIKVPKIIVNVFSEISLNKKLEYPLAYLLFIHFYILNVDKQEGKKMLYEIKAIYTERHSNNILAEIALVELLASYNNIYKMSECLDTAYALFGNKVSKIYNLNTLSNFIFPYTLIIWYTQKGKLREVIEYLKTHFYKYNKLTNNLISGYDKLLEAEFCYEIGDFKNAELLAYKTYFKALTQKQLILVCSSVFVLIKIAILNDKLQDLDDYINELKYNIESTNDTLLLTELDIIIGYAYSSIGQIEKIPSWLCDYNKLKNVLTYCRECSYIVHFKFLMMTQNFNELERISTEFLIYEQQHNHILGTIIVKIFNSIALYNLYGIEKAEPIILEAIEYAKSDNIVTPFLIPNLIHILPEIKNDYAENILKKYKGYYKKAKSINLISKLNEREREVIDLAAEGYKNLEIADNLEIALATVEKTLSNVYKKLNVKNRMSAIKIIKNL